MNPFTAGAGLALVLAALFAGLYGVLSAFAQALESLSSIKRKALLEENPRRFRQLLSPEYVHVSRIAVRMTAQSAVLGGLLSLGPFLATLGLPEPWLIAAITLLFGWLVLEAFVVRQVALRGADEMLRSFAWLAPVATLCAVPLYPFLARLVDDGEEEEDGRNGRARAKESPDTPDREREREQTKEIEMKALLDVAREEGLLEKHEEELVSRAVDFGDRTVREVMTPRPDMTVADVTAPLSEIVDLFVRTKFTPTPLVRGVLSKPAAASDRASSLMARKPTTRPSITTTETVLPCALKRATASS